MDRMVLRWRRLRPGHYVALTPTQTFEAARSQACWIVIGRDWPGPRPGAGSIYETWGLGHFSTLRECKERVEQFIADSGRR